MRHPQAGVTLVEVLIALLLLAFGLIGIAAMQTAAINNNVVSAQYTQAATLVQNMAERMRANRDGVVNNRYAFPVGPVTASPPVDCSQNVCSSADQAAWDIAAWYATATPVNPLGNVPAGPTANLPDVQVSITCPAVCTPDAVRVIALYWNGDLSDADGTGCDAANDDDLRCFRLPFLP